MVVVVLEEGKPFVGAVTYTLACRGVKKGGVGVGVAGSATLVGGDAGLESIIKRGVDVPVGVSV
jgi:hypothetical protein